MGETRDNEAYEEELLDYEEEEEKALDSVTAKVNGEATKKWVIFFLFFHFHFFIQMFPFYVMVLIFLW